MSKVLIDRAVVEQALGALFMYKPMVTGVTFQHGLDAMQALRAALEQPQVEQEPCNKSCAPGHCYCEEVGKPQPPRQPLTDQQIHDCFQHRHRDKATERRMITRAIEEAIWKKNS